MKFIIFVVLAIWFYLIALVLTKRRRHISERLGEYVFEDSKTQHKRDERRDTVPVWHRWLGTLAMSWVRRWPRERIEKIQMRLLRAHSRWSVGEWVSLQLTALLGALVLSGLLIWATHFSLRSMVAGAAIVLLGWLLPDFWLSRRITGRQNLLRRQLPSTLDLLTVSVEAGLGFDQAMARVAQESRGPMADESNRILHEMQLGTPRLEALQRFAERTDVDEIELFVAAVVQADKLGIGLTKVLRIQAEEVRRKQREQAQEQAAKAPIKILFPLIVFIFPALFVVILGPAVLSIIHTFAGGGAGL